MTLWDIPTQAPTRHEMPETSRAAARTVRVQSGRELVLETLRNIGPSTDERIYQAISFEISPSGCRSRRAELVRLGLVVAVGIGKTASGRDCQVWEAVK